MDELTSEIEQLRAQKESLESRLYDLEATPHTSVGGDDDSYSQSVRRVREAVRETVPHDATLAVISHGDDRLLDAYGRRAWHFPRAADGRYAGYHPKRGISAIAHLEVLRGQGADFLLIPETCLWWLEFYPSFRRHLEHHYAKSYDAPGVCVIYALGEPAKTAGNPTSELASLLEDTFDRLGDDPAVLDWDSGAELSRLLPDRLVFSPPRSGRELPYLDDTIDVVVVSTTDELIIDEARRVASKVLVNLAARSGRSRRKLQRVEWKDAEPDAGLETVSIVIPCHDGLAHTRTCLSTLAETLPRAFRGEIIAIDDHSADGTGDFLKEVRVLGRRIRVVRNQKNLGFLASCNRGARLARSHYLIFLNNDTVLLPGWLPPLMQTFHDFPDAGVVGGKLLFEDGRLQEAGGLVFSDASAAKIGYRDPDPEAPLYQHVREVDYVSGALLMTPRDLFWEIGGLDPRYGFGYYEDDDYCFAVRRAGRRVLFQPKSVIVHVEGAAAGTDLSKGLKQHQAVNQSVFAEKWRRKLNSQPRRPENLDPYSLRSLEVTPRGTRQ